MFGRKVIAILVLTLYVAATGANAFGVLSCDCISHHRHDLCCAHDEHRHHSDDCCGHGHAAFCATDGCQTALAQHCECTHRHGGEAVYTVTTDNDELLKYIKTYASEMLHSRIDPTDAAAAKTAGQFRITACIPVPAPPLISAGAPRAPDVEA